MLGSCTLAACQFDKSPTTGIFIFELLIVAVAAVLLVLLVTHKNYDLLKRFGRIAGGVLIFEIFTQPLWNSYRLGIASYLYVDVSWVLTLGWSLILFFSWVVADRFVYGTKKKKKGQEIQSFFLTLLISVIAGLIGEQIVLALGIRSYSPEVQSILTGIALPLTQVPVEAIFYMPVFMTLVLSFAKYWEIVFGKIPLVPQKRIVNCKSFLIAFIGVFLYEVMNAPAVRNVGWPSWSYAFYDVNLLRIAIWVLVLAIGGSIIHRLFIHTHAAVQFIASMFILTLITVPIEGWLVSSGMRQYGESLKAGFSGYHIPGTNLPGELLFAIPLYLALIIAFVRYWVSVWENDL